jgi:hypothetical protein
LSDVAQQIRFAPEQSLSVLQALGQLERQIPPQQSCAPGTFAQSVDVLHALGHASKAGFRQSPSTVTLESTALTVVQQTSPMEVWQSVLEAQLLGHSDGVRQMCWL